MPSKTNTEAIRDLERMMAILEERVETIRSALDNQAGELRKAVEADHLLDKRLTVLESQFTEAKQKREEDDRRRHASWLILIGSVLTLLINVVLLFLGKR